MNRSFVLDRQNAKLMGVAAGVADYAGLDATVVRLGFIIGMLVTGPILIFLYLTVGLIAPAH